MPPGAIVDSDRMLVDQVSIATDPADEAAIVDTAEAIVAALRSDILAGEPWYTALLGAVARWRLPIEHIDGRQYRYLIGGEAFDWLVLAERLTDTISDLIPAAERDDLLFFGCPPDGDDDERFRRLIGPAKHRAHLNFLYGVILEDALQLAAEEERHKEIRCRVWGVDHRVDETAFERVYGRPKDELLQTFREERGLPQPPVLTLLEQREFTYWLFKRRVQLADPARVASDTRRALAQISQMQAARRRLRSPAEEDAGEGAIDVALGWSWEIHQPRSEEDVDGL